MSGYYERERINTEWKKEKGRNSKSFITVKRRNADQSLTQHSNLISNQMSIRSNLKNSYLIVQVNFKKIFVGEIAFMYEILASMIISYLVMGQISSKKCRAMNTVI